MQFEINDCKRKANELLIKERRALEDKKDEATRKFNDLHKKITILERGIGDKKRRIEALNGEKSELGKQYNAEITKVFDEAPYLFDESKWVSGEVTLCGLPLPSFHGYLLSPFEGSTVSNGKNCPFTSRYSW